MGQKAIPEKVYGVKRISKAFFYSLKGLKHAFMNEAAFRQEAIISFFLIPIAIIMPVEIIYKVLMIISILQVMIVELLNSSVEAVVDYLTNDYQKFAEIAKDMCSAAVLFTIIIVLVCWAAAGVSLL